MYRADGCRKLYAAQNPAVPFERRASHHSVGTGCVEVPRVVSRNNRPDLSMRAFAKFAAAWFRPATFAAMLIVGWAFLRAQPGPDPERLRTNLPLLGAHTLLGQEEGNGVSPAVTPAITTQVSGSSLIVFNAGYRSNSNPPADSKSNRWKQLGEDIYKGYDARFDVKAYVALAAKGGSNHTVSIVKDGNPVGEITLPFIEIRNADILQDVAHNYPATGATLTSDGVTTTGPATLVAVWWGDGAFKQNSAEPGNGFAVIESFVKLPENSAVQCVVAYKDVDRAGTYNVTWTNTPAQGAPLWLFAFQSSAAATSSTKKD